MAHSGEAQGVIETFNMTKVRSDLYTHENMVLLLTGEGPFEAATRTALIIPEYNISSVINLGIAGSLSVDLKPGDFVPVRTIYLVHDLKPAFKTFQSLEQGMDCLTSFERILDAEKAKVLKGIGHLVDREAWGVAMASKTAGVPFKSYKMISDVAGTPGACELIKEEARELSARLAEKLPELLNIEFLTEQDVSLPGFHFTFSTRHRYKNLLHKLSIKEEKSPEAMIHNLPVEELRSLELSPKERSKRLLEIMEDRIDPFRKVIAKATLELQEIFQKEGFRLQIDPVLENPKVTISLEAGSDEELQNKLDTLKKISLKPFTDIMKGEFNVE
jgi:nucleoside phosphorylase